MSCQSEGVSQHSGEAGRSDDLAREDRPGSIVFASSVMRQIQDELKQAARSDAKILLTGESGVGKEVLARLVHDYSPRRSRGFIAINCAGVPDTLLESELFGHVRGSFTGAYRDKAGLFEQADGGTIFLDEIGEMSLRMQALLLRFLEDGDIQRVGSERRTTTIDVRVVTATNRVLLDRIASGVFREDLYYRINVVHVVVPPLRDRREEIEPLFRHFVHLFSRKYRVTTPDVAGEVIDKMIAYDWPGNVRELKNVVERLIVRSRSGCIGLQDLSPTIAGPGSLVFAGGSQAADIAGSATTRSRNPKELYDRIVGQRESFWSAVYEPFMARDLTRDDVRAIVTAGLEHARGDYKALLPLFNMPAADYKRFLNFLRKHDCHMPFHKLRMTEIARVDTRAKVS
jgi:transcriptional regulator with PAS, ATPase and Fis domain